MNKLLFRLFISSLLIATILPAQESNSASPGETSTDVVPAAEGSSAYNVSIRFYTWPLKGILHSGVDVKKLPDTYLSFPGKPTRVILSRGSITRPFLYVGENAPMLISPIRDTSNPNLVSGTKTIAAPTFPREWSQALVLLFPDRIQSDGSWGSVALPVSGIALPDGTSRFINTTQNQIILEIDGDRMVMEPSQSMPVPKVEDKERVRIRLFAEDSRGRIRRLYTSSHSQSDENKNLYIIYEQELDRYRVLHLDTQDMEPPPVPTPEAE
jgi:hypothetical protein